MPYAFRPRWPLVAVLAAVVLVTLQKGVLTGHPGNYLLFRFSYYRLVGGVDIYHPPEGEMTGFLYSPTYALLFAPFALPPVPLGLLLWNGVNALALYAGLMRVLPSGGRAATGALAIVFIDMVRSLQNSQSNALVAGLILLAFAALAAERRGSAAGAVLLGGFVKIFPVAAGVLGLLRPRPWRFVAWCAAWAVGLALLPLLVLAPGQLVAVYRDWGSILQRDVGLQGQSVMRILGDWFGIAAPNWTVQLAGTLVLLAPLARGPRYWAGARFRLLFLCSLLVFLVIFNHQAESPSFVIATSGVAVWYVTSARARWRDGLLALTLLLVSAGQLFFVPFRIYHNVIHAHALNAFPCLVVWIVMQVELWRLQPGEVDQGDAAAREGVPERGRA